MVIRILLPVILALLAAPLQAAEHAGLQDILAAVKKGYASMNDLQADFSQKTYVAALKREEKGSGEVFLKKRDGNTMFRFNYMKPKQQIISNGKTVWYYLPDNKQVILTDVSKLFSGGNGMALSYLTGLGNLETDFTIRLLTEKPDTKGVYLLELLPKQQNPAVARLQLAVSAATIEKAAASGNIDPFFPIASSVLHDQLGNRTTIEYRKVKVNGGLANDRFSFRIPAGIDVIKQ
jgi:outer membrane lipoprotein carrier protein